MIAKNTYDKLNTLYKQSFSYQGRDYKIYEEFCSHVSFPYIAGTVNGYVFVAHEFNPGCYPYLDKLYFYCPKARTIYLLMDISSITEAYRTQPVLGLTKKQQYIYVKTIKGVYRVDLAGFLDMQKPQINFGQTIITPNEYNKLENLFLITPTSANSFVFETKPEVKLLDMLRFPPFSQRYGYFCITHLGEGRMYSCEFSVDGVTYTSYGGRLTMTRDSIWEMRDKIIDAYFRVVPNCSVAVKYAPRTVDKFYIKKM